MRETTTLRRAHDARRVDDLVGRHLDHRERAVFLGGVGDIHGADDIGEYALARIHLDHRHMFQSRGVKDELRPVPLEYLLDPLTAADAAKIAPPRKFGEAFRERHVDCVEIVFRVVDQDDLRRFAGGNLGRQLASDRAAGSGDEHPAPANEATDRLPVERCLRPFQEIGQFDRAQLVGVVALGALQLRHLRQARNGDAQSFCGSQQAVGCLLAKGRRGFGEDDVTRLLALLLQLCDYPLEVLNTAGDRHATQAHSGLILTPVEACDGRARADEQQRNSVVVLRVPAAPGFENRPPQSEFLGTEAQPRSCQEGDEQERLHRNNGARDVGEPGREKQQRDEQQRGQQHRSQNDEKVGNGTIFPISAVEAGEGENECAYGEVLRTRP